MALRSSVGNSSNFRTQSVQVPDVGGFAAKQNSRTNRTQRSPRLDVTVDPNVDVFLGISTRNFSSPNQPIQSQISIDLAEAKSVEALKAIVGSFPSGYTLTISNVGWLFQTLKRLEACKDDITYFQNLTRPRIRSYLFTEQRTVMGLSPLVSYLTVLADYNLATDIDADLFQALRMFFVQYSKHMLCRDARAVVVALDKVNCLDSQILGFMLRSFMQNGVFVTAAQCSSLALIAARNGSPSRQVLWLARRFATLADAEPSNVTIQQASAVLRAVYISRVNDPELSQRLLAIACDRKDDVLTLGAPAICLAYVLYYGAQLGVATPSVTVDLSLALVQLAPSMSTQDCRFVLVAWRVSNYTPSSEHARGFLARIVEDTDTDRDALVRAIQSCTTLLNAQDGSTVLAGLLAKFFAMSETPETHEILRVLMAIKGKTQLSYTHAVRAAEWIEELTEHEPATSAKLLAYAPFVWASSETLDNQKVVELVERVVRYLPEDSGIAITLVTVLKELKVSVDRQLTELLVEVYLSAQCDGTGAVHLLTELSNLHNSFDQSMLTALTTKVVEYVPHGTPQFCANAISALVALGHQFTKEELTRLTMPLKIVASDLCMHNAARAMDTLAAINCSEAKASCHQLEAFLLANVKTLRAEMCIWLVSAWQQMDRKVRPEVAAKLVTRLQSISDNSTVADLEAKLESMTCCSEEAVSFPKTMSSISVITTDIITGGQQPDRAMCQAVLSSAIGKEWPTSPTEKGEAGKLLEVVMRQLPSEQVMFLILCMYYAGNRLPRSLHRRANAWFVAALKTFDCQPDAGHVLERSAQVWGIIPSPSRTSEGEELFIRTVEAYCRETAARASFQTISTVAWALRRGLIQKRAARVVPSIRKIILEQCDIASPRYMAVATHSLATSLSALTRQDMSRILAAFLEKVEEVNERDVCMMLSAAAGLGWKENADYLHMLRQRALKWVDAEEGLSMPDAFLVACHRLDLHLSASDVAHLLQQISVMQPRSPRAIPAIFRAAAHYDITDCCNLDGLVIRLFNRVGHLEQSTLADLYISWASLPETAITNDHVELVRNKLRACGESGTVTVAAGDLLRNLVEGREAKVTDVNNMCKTVVGGVKFLSSDAIVRIICALELSGKAVQMTDLDMLVGKLWEAQLPDSLARRVQAALIGLGYNG